MKKFAFFVPVLIFVLMTTLGTRLFASGASPISMVLLMLVPLVLLFILQPKKGAAKPASDLEQKVRGEFAKDAFAEEPKLGALFQAALKDYNSNMPKAALNKLTKLAAQCTGDPEIYAVAMATAQCHMILGKPLIP